MHVKSTLLCRASEKVYELLSITDLPEGADVALVYRERDGHAPLPCRIVPLGRHEAETRVVAVYPDLPLEGAHYVLAERSREGALSDEHVMEVAFPSAKWRSRINYRTKPEACAEIRCIDERTPELGDAAVKVLTVISMAEHIMLRISLTLPDDGSAEDVRFACVNSRLEEVSSGFVFLGESTLPSPVEGGPSMRRITFSCKIPYNQGDLCLCAYEAGTRRVRLARCFTQARCDELREEMDRLLYRHAAHDPYYDEWLSLHRATDYELELQRSHQPCGGKVKFSVIVPLYKTPLDLFRDMAESMLAQTYRTWELILVNASPECDELAHEVGLLCSSDARVRSVELGENLGISENTNAGISVATGDYVCFFDHDDLLEPDALYEYALALEKDPEIDLLYCDEDKLMPDGTHSEVFFKPDFSIDLLRNNNYVCHMLTIRKSLLEQLEPNTREFDGAQDHNLTLEAAERTTHIHHVPKVLYHWRLTPQSAASGTDSKPYAVQAGIRAVRSHLERLGLKATVSPGEQPFTYTVVYDVPEPSPLVSIVIPTKDNPDVLRRCVTSVFEKSTYECFEVVLVDNGSELKETWALYDELTRTYGERVSVISRPEQFNFSRLVNAGALASKGDYLLLLNNDTEVITTNWIEIMLGLCARSDVGAVGVKLLFPDGTIQHAGVNTTGEPGHFFAHLPDGSHSYLELLDMPRDLSAVTGACMMTSRAAFDLVGGFDEGLAVAYNDIDYCFKLQEKGLLVVYTPLVRMYHYESLSRGFDEDPASRARYIREKATLTARWAERFAVADPYYTPNLRPGLPYSSYYVF
ncbi:glycosyltransferase family 2 protein [Olsenella sp. SW781]|uniref:glycosyltransferase family 2 protein n=1 Tax=Olsenella sp. SW781 TaxID=2530046 RepID=UPI001438B8FD|nr:glycosyltransferase family 2 protein [Olsenella sp. SW781]